MITSLDFDLVGIKLVGSARHRTVRIYIDSPEGITVDHCALVSRQVSAILDVEDPISGEYILEVSSPGIDRPIMKRSDFDKFSGEEVQIKLSFPVEDRKNWRGKLLGMNEDTVAIETDGQEFALPFSDIKDCRLVPKA